MEQVIETANSGSRVKSIKVVKPIGVIIIENGTLNHIRTGSRLFCGICGGILGTTTRPLHFPFLSNEFIASLNRDHGIERSPMGVYHSACKKVLFPRSGRSSNWGFVPLNIYFESIYNSLK